MVCNHCGKSVNGGTYINGVFYCPWCTAEITQKMQVRNPVKDLNINNAPCRGCPRNPSNGCKDTGHCQIIYEIWHG